MSIKCWDCKFNYEESAFITLQYQCWEKEHYITVCVNCAQKYRKCREDDAQLTQESEGELDDMIEDDSINKNPVND